jgi:uncharacterized protein HemX
MKSLLYIGAALMVGAGIYGFIDYRKANDSKEFRTLYRNEDKAETKQPEMTKAAPVAAMASLVTMEKETAVAKSEPVIAKKNTAKKKKSKKINSKLFSRAALEEFEPPVESPGPAKAEVK